MTFIDLSLANPVVRAQDTITGELGAIGARFIMAGASPRAMAEGGPTADFRPIAGWAVAALV